MSTSSFGLIGLGVMGQSLALNIAEKGHTLSVYNRSEGAEAQVVSQFLASNPFADTTQGFTELDAFANSLETPRRIMIMIKAGPALDQVINALSPHLSEGDIVIDGGNSHFGDTARRYNLLAKHNIGFVGAGISGGEEGARKGPSIMPGGNQSDYTLIAPVLESIAAKDKSGKPCCSYIGPEGAGHFVKMVHNGIEYAEMQLLAEIYTLLAPTMNYDAIADLFEQWNQGELANYLLEITIDIFRKKEGEHYLLDLILDKAGNKGTGSWSSKTALDLGQSNNMMAAAVFARYFSSQKEQRTQWSKTQQSGSDSNIDIQAIEAAYRFARMMNHHQGFALMQAASAQYSWNLSLADIARVWTNGCIIRSTLMEQSAVLLATQDSLLDDTITRESLWSQEQSVAEILQYGIAHRLSLPAFTAAHQAWVAMTSERLSANLIQAQRDYFGAHTYQRVDTPSGDFFHTSW